MLRAANKWHMTISCSVARVVRKLAWSAFFRELHNFVSVKMKCFGDYFHFSEGVLLF